MSKAVVVTTAHRGVFFGNTDQNPSDTITLKDARMCVYWSAAMRGVLGLASAGPDKDCRISNAVPELELHGVTAVMQCSPEAVERWESAPWK